MSNLKSALEGREPDYLIVQHMEPDHSSNINLFADAFPNALIVASERAFIMMKQFFGRDYADRRIVIKDGDTLELGCHKLNFIGAAMIHWPEVMMTYEESEKVLFSADGFGKFGALDADEDWACEARRYYFGIVGKYGAQVQKLLAKASGLEIGTICPLHGPILTENLGYYIDLYNTWSSYGVESEGVAIAYTSVYGNTKKAVMLLAEELQKLGCPKVAVSDLARDDMSEANCEEIKRLALELAGDHKMDEKEEKNVRYVCEICGYEYDEAVGDPDNGIAPGTKFEDLPEDFTCPLCGVEKSNFKKED